MTLRWTPEQLAEHQRRRAREIAARCDDVLVRMISARAEDAEVPALCRRPAPDHDKDLARFRAELALAGVPRPETEYRFAPPRRWRADYCWPGRLIVEIDGGAFTGGRHTRGRGFVNDLEKLNAAALMGYRVLRYTPQQLTRAVAEIAQLLGGSAWDAKPQHRPPKSSRTCGQGARPASTSRNAAGGSRATPTTP